MTRFAPTLVAAPLLGALVPACSPSESAPPDEVSAGATPSSPAVAPAPPGEGVGHRDTRLSACTLERSAPEEAGFAEHLCPGEGGFRLRLTESDLRQNIHLLAPGGGEHDLGLPALADGAFSSVGDTLEWRGSSSGGAFTPHALILRQSVMENPDPAVPETSYLVVARLGSSPCVVARIAPGPGQNERAREAADADGECLA